MHFVRKLLHFIHFYVNILTVIKMDIKNFVLSYYKNATKNFHITEITAPDEALKLHSHNYFQVYYILSGKLIHHIENGYAFLSYGDVFILPPDTPHYIETKGDNVDFYSMSFMPAFLKGHRQNNKLVSDFLYYLTNTSLENIQPKFNLSPEDVAFTEAVFKRIMTEFNDEKTGKEIIIKECVLILLSLFARVYFEEKADKLITEQNKNSVMHCVEYIKTHFDEDITLSQMVKLSAMSKTSFCSIFTSVTKTTFKDYLNSLRIKKGCELISKGEKISTVSNLCGYGDFSTFYRNFKKHMKISPSEYQRIHCK